MTKRRKSPVEIVTTEPHMCSLDVRLRILRSVPFFKSLSDQDVEAVNRYFKEMGFSPGEYLYLSGDLGRRLFVLAEGRVRLLRLTASGKQVMLDLIIPGEFFGSLSQDGQPYPDSAQAQTPVCALAISADDFRSLLAAYPPVALDVLDSLSARLQEAHNSIHLLSAEPAEKRIAYILLKLGKKLGRPGSEGLLIETPLGRDELADMTGITTETASRVISQFQKEGWIATGRQWVAIKDEAALNDILS
ncbi:MAG: Crp/Fnr family transcriptional regulator [Chloroflexi bacterium]|nr:Crp/Fnr family transcriptional regulator [Chloroflexota bacterium]